MGNAASYSIINIGILMARRFESESPSSAPPLSIREDTEIMKITAESTNENGTKHIKFISDIAEYKRIVTSNLAQFLVATPQKALLVTVMKK